MNTPHRPKSHDKPHDADKPKSRGDHPPPEEDFGGGDFVAPEVSPPTDDDKPLE